MALVAVGALVTAFYLVYSYQFYGEWSGMLTYLLWVLLLAILFVPLGLTVPKTAWKTSLVVFLFVALTFLAMAFHQEVKQTGDLNAGGPLTVALVIGVLPVLHLGWKLVLWVYFGIAMFLVSETARASGSWTLIFYSVAIFILSLAQAQTDRLLRYQFRVEQLERLKAQTDQLTGSLNRYAFEQRMTELLSSLSEQDCLALAMIDIDHFKRYNDHYGHLQGDMALVEVAQVLNTLPAELVVRFGGEEFVIVCRFKGQPPDWLSQLPQNLALQHIEHAQSPYGVITVSVGVVAYCHHKGSPLPNNGSLLARADRNLYKAKQKGRNRLCLTWVD